ncbi:hypothetical protein ACFPZL_05110 [Leucobacter soli]|uniref:Uncharacterized protein n=1 Tax=Leucobacter soli TaxID=2812850 RepID=A0A916JUV9_9MICO|nr:hypothetical protein [Leucobacter soli]CAG7604409.1 hypothetical protein LEUCIP111803_00734 [Leucobacter soli]
MILWFAIAQIAVALLAAVVSLAVFARRSAPNDYALGATLLVSVLLLAQIVVAIVAPFAGNPPAGDPLEFWMYLIVAAALPFGAGFWALVDRKRSANLVLLVVHVSVAVMLYRMLVIWG